MEEYTTTMLAMPAGDYGGVDVSQKDVTLSQSAFAQAWLRGEETSLAPPPRPTKPLAQSEWLYICLNKLISTCRSIPLMLGTANDEIVESGEAWDLLFRNPKLPWQTFLTETLGYFALYHCVYWIFEKSGWRVTGVRVAGPEQMRPLVERGEIVAWELIGAHGRRETLLPDEVYRVSDFDPYGGTHGLGPAIVGKIAISTGYQAGLLNEATLAHGAKLSAAIVYPPGVRLDDEERRMLRSQFETRHAGAANAGRAAVLTGGAEIKTYSQTMADLEMIELQGQTATTICGLLGVPPEVVGLNSEAQYAHGPAQQRFIGDTVTSLLGFVADHLTRVLPGSTAGMQSVKASSSRTLRWRRLGLGLRESYCMARAKAVQEGRELFAWFDVDSHPTMAAAKRETAEKVLTFTQSGVPLNALIDAHDLPYEQVPWGDDWWLPLGLAPARFTLEGGLEAVTGPSLPEGGEEGPKPKPEKEEGEENPKKSVEPESREKRTARELAVWRKWAASWQGLEREYGQSLRTLWVRQQRKLVASLRKAWPTEKGVKARTAGEDLIGQLVFDWLGEQRKLQQLHMAFHKRATEVGVRQVLAEIAGVTGEAADAATKRLLEYPGVRRAIAQSTHQMGGVTATTKKLIERQLRQGIDAGDDLNAMVRRLEEVLGNNRARALSVARTEVGGAVSCGRQEGMREVGGELKCWITSQDDHVRKLHHEAGQRYAKGIPLEEHFVLGGDLMMYPGDPAASAANRVNCRCLHIVKSAKGKSFGLDHYERIEFVRSA